MLRISSDDFGTNIVRFFPNIDDLKNNTIVQKYFSYEKQPISVNEYWDLRKDGKKPHAITRYFSYAQLNGKHGLWQHGLTVNRFIRACLFGEYFETPDGDFLLEEELGSRNKSDFKFVEFTPFNPFDLKEPKAIQFEVSYHMGFPRYSHFKIIESEDYRIYKEGDDQEFIKDFIKAFMEETPQPVYF